MDFQTHPQTFPELRFSLEMEGGEPKDSFEANFFEVTSQG